MMTVYVINMSMLNPLGMKQSISECMMSTKNLFTSKWPVIKYITALFDTTSHLTHHLNEPEGYATYLVYNKSVRYATYLVYNKPEGYATYLVYNKSVRYATYLVYNKPVRYTTYLVDNKPVVPVQ